VVPPLAQFDPEALEFFHEYVKQRPSLPSLCTGDFDGNGLADAALLLHKDRRSWVVAAFHQTYQGSFRAYELARWSRRRMYREWGSERGKLGIFLARMPKDYKIEGVQGNVDVIQALDPNEYSSMFFYYDKGRYHKRHHGEFREWVIAPVGRPTVDGSAVRRGGGGGGYDNAANEPGGVGDGGGVGRSDCTVRRFMRVCLCAQ
jgi:hypothetical protein